MFQMSLTLPVLHDFRLGNGKIKFDVGGSNRTNQGNNAGNRIVKAVVCFSHGHFYR